MSIELKGSGVITAQEARDRTARRIVTIEAMKKCLSVIGERIILTMMEGQYSFEIELGDLYGGDVDRLESILREAGYKTVVRSPYFWISWEVA